MRPLGEIMVVCSLEGALLDQDGKMPKANRDVMRLYCSRGGRLTVASDRSPAFVCAALGDAPVTEPVICSGGATLYDINNRDYIAQRVMNSVQAREMLEAAMMAFPHVGVAIQRQDGTMCVVRANAHTKAYMDTERSGYVLQQLCDVKEPWVRVVLTGKPDQMDRLEQYAARRSHGADVALIRAADHYCEILAAGVDKGSALRELAKTCEMPQPYIYSIGGQFSDQALMQMTGHAIAVPDSPVRVKLAAELVTRLEKQEGGAGEFLYRLIKEYEK